VGKEQKNPYKQNFLEKPIQPEGGREKYHNTTQNKHAYQMNCKKSMHARNLPFTFVMVRS
jgi:uncharacterized protein YceK